ncbi:MAG TPA: DNA polymerase III subunit gamma and tau, partial [Pseudolysinimonas sp.]|nr:DNA polymerase III subunit gamma and tau [Pseudolysinimonas sp.]
KVIGTIRSRTHHYPFRLVPPAQMLDYVQKMCVDEKVEVEGGVLPLVVRAGGGSVRDTLSLLDQLIAGSEGGTIQYERAVALLGYTHGALLDEVVDAIGARDAAGVFAAIDRVIQTGQDPRRFVEDLLERLRDLIVVAATRDGASAVLRGVPLDQIDRMSGQSAAFGAAELSRAADVVNSALTEMTGATSPRLHLELMVARLLVPAADESERGALARVERLERRMGIDEHPSMRAVPDRPAVEPVDIRTARKAKEEAAPVVEPPAGAEPSAASVTFQQIKDSWPEILEIVKGSKRNAWMALAASTPRAFTGDVLTVAFATEADVASFKQPQSPGESVSEQLRGAIHEVLGVRVKFLARHEAGAAQAPQPTDLKPDIEADVKPDENPLPPAPEWNVVQIPSNEPPAPEAAVPAASAPAASERSAPEPSVPQVIVPEKRAPQQNTADGTARYGEAVVREILGASFIEEQALRPAAPPPPLDSLDD